MKITALVVVVLGMVLGIAGPVMGAEWVWLEGEKPTSINVKANMSGWGKKEFLSEEKWLHLSIDAAKVESEVPAEGVLIAYEFAVGVEGRYEVWNRIGFEFARSAFEWRMDGGAWVFVGPEQLTCDLMEIDFWCEVAWLKLGDVRLSKGGHKLEIRLPKAKDEKGKVGRILYALDAICLYGGEFWPNSKFRPGEAYRDERDAKASEQVFDISEGKGEGGRVVARLGGLWEVCRHDEQMPGETAEAMKDFPKEPHWKAIEVPGDKNKLRPDLVFAHRLWYRTRVNMPAKAAGRSFYIVFPQNNLNTTVYVNGVYCGFDKNPYARVQIDVTKGMKAGVNEVWVGIKDAWYGYSTNPRNPLKLRKTFNYPLSVTQRGFQDLAYPIWNAFESGILATPELVMAGRVYTSDAFVKTSVEKKRIGVDLTVRNTGSGAVEASAALEAVDERTEAVAWRGESRLMRVDGGGEVLERMEWGWGDAKLWWPDDPQMYKLRVTLRVGGEVVDVSETPFGFREWTSEGRDFKLNGIVWHGWADCFTARGAEEWLGFYRKSNQKMMRLWGTSWQGMSPGAALDFFDRNGVVVRRSGMLDGEAIGYNAVEHDPDLKKESEIKMDLMRNWRDQMVAQVKGERNHPSVMLWSIENEWLYINCLNLHGGLMDQFEAEVRKVSEAVRAADPTRLTMTDGGGANKDNSMPVHGNHYVFGGYSRYPTLAYEVNAEGGGRGRWVWDEKRPRFIGEDFFANGINPFDYSYFGGEETFGGKAQSRRAAGLIYRMLTEGYRWSGQGAWHFWMGQHEAVGQYGSNAPIAVFCREWDWTFGSGQTVKRTLRIFNDTRYEEPITFSWVLTVGGRKVGGERREHRVGAGKSEGVELSLAMPRVNSRVEGELVLSLEVKGVEVFRDVKGLSVLGGIRKSAVLGGMTKGDLLVYDPRGEAGSFLESLSMPFTALGDLKVLPDAGKVLIVGRDGLGKAESTSSKFLAYASGGRSVIILEQENPLKYQGICAEMEPEANAGQTAYGEDLDHPVFVGLKQGDFFAWGRGEVVYRNAYRKPTRGGKSLVQCHERLENTALCEIPAGKGIVLLSQLTIGENLASSAVARQLLANLIGYGAGYRLEHRQVVLCMADAGELGKVLDAAGVQYSKVEDAVGAVEVSGAGIAVIGGSARNLRALAGSMEKVEAFTRRGGWIVLNGVGPAGLEDYNRIVGVEHMIRPFGRERVTFPAVRNPLTAGLTTADIVMQSGKRINTFTSDVYLASDVFSHVVDYDEVAAFARFPEAGHFGYTDSGNDHNPRNMVNGFVSADGWQYIFSIPVGKGSPTSFSLVFPREQELTELEWIGNAFYNVVTKVELTFDGGEKVVFGTQPNNEAQTFAIEPARKTRELTINLAGWEKVSRTEVIGVDNIRLKARRSAEFYRTVKPMLNIGAMMQYVKGSGGVVLCNILFQETESVPENGAKKRAILSAVLRNLKAPFSGGSTVFAGADVRYRPVDISKWANQYRDERGFFGDRNATFRDMPTGRQVFGGVPFQIYEFPTSPVPTIVMLNGPGIPNRLAEEVRGIEVNGMADALFFLHTARIDARMNGDEVKRKKRYEMMRYVVRYADGEAVEVPIYSEVDVDDYRQKEPRAIPGAQIAWVRAYEGRGEWAVAYCKQWDNPRPGVEIRTIDVVYGKDRRGVPAVLAITGASAK